MPQFQATLPDGRTVTFDADRQPTNEEFQQILQQQEEQEHPKTSALGSFVRGAASAAAPTTAAMAAFGTGAEIGAGLGEFLAPWTFGLSIPAGALIGGGISSAIAASVTSKGQEAVHDLAHVVMPETIEKMDKLNEAGLTQHPIASAGGRLAAMLPSAEFAPQETAYGLSKIPAWLSRTANAAESKAARGVVSGIASQTGLQVGQSLAETGKLPSKGEIAEGVVAAALFHEPRFQLTPKAVSAAAEAIAEKGRTYASRFKKTAEVHGDVRTQPGEGKGQVPPEGGGPGVQPQAEKVAEEPQVPLDRKVWTEEHSDGSYTVHSQFQDANGVQHKVEVEAADEYEAKKTADRLKNVREHPDQAEQAPPPKTETPPDLPGEKGNRFAHVSGTKEKGFKIRWQGQVQSGFKSMEEAMNAADQIESGKRKLKPDVYTGEEAELPKEEPKGPFTKELTPDEVDQHEQDKQEESDRDKTTEQKLQEKATKLGTKVNVQGNKAPKQTDIPFAASAAGAIAQYNPDTGAIDVNRDNLRTWMARIPEELHDAALDSVIDEEHIHSKTSDKDALDYWNSLSWPEKLLVQRGYTGKWFGRPEHRPQGFSDVQLGHEALRTRLQQLMYRTPREAIEAQGSDVWTKKMILFFQGLIQNIRTRLGTSASKRQAEILDRMMVNLQVLKAAESLGVSGGRPFVAANATMFGPLAFDQIAFHGTPHEFDRFDVRHIGRGEGSQMYGWGLYFAQQRQVSEEYAKRMGRGFTVNGQPFETKNYHLQDFLNASVKYGPEKAAGYLDMQIEDLTNDLLRAQKEGNALREKSAQQSLRSAMEAKAASKDFEGKTIKHVAGHVFEVRLDVTPDDLLDLDKPLRDQPKKVKDVLLDELRARWLSEKSKLKEQVAEAREYILSWAPERTKLDEAKRLIKEYETDSPQIDEDVSMKEVFSDIQGYEGWYSNGPDYELAQKLAKAGVKGIRYFDQLSRDEPEEGEVVSSNIKMHGQEVFPEEHGPGPEEHAAYHFDQAGYDREKAIAGVQEQLDSEVTPHWRDYYQQSIDLLKNKHWTVGPPTVEPVEDKRTRNFVIFNNRDIRVYRRGEEHLPLHPDSLEAVAKDLEEAWNNRLWRPEDVKQPNERRTIEEGPFIPEDPRQRQMPLAFNQFGDPYGSSYPASEEDWAEWNRLKGIPMITPQGEIDQDLFKAREAMKNKYGGMPPLPPGTPPRKAGEKREGPQAFDQQAFDDELRRRKEAREARVKRKQKKEEKEALEGKKQPELSATPEEELRRREELKAARIHRKALETTDVPAGLQSLGQQSMFMPPAAERVVEPIGTAEAGALPALTPVDIEGSYGKVALNPDTGKYEPVPDKPGWADHYLNGPIAFTAAPRTRVLERQGTEEERRRKAELLGPEQEYTEYRRRSDRPNYREFKEKLLSVVAGHWPEERIREVWYNAVWRHLNNASPERLVEWAKTSRSKILRKYQAMATPDAVKLLKEAEPTYGPQGPQELPTGYRATTGGEAGGFGLEQELEDKKKQRRLDIAARLERRRFAREQKETERESTRKATINKGNLRTQIGLELLGDAKPREQPLDRTTVDLADIDFDETTSQHGAVRDISKEESSSPAALAAILGDKGGRAFPGSSTSPVSHTKRVVALLDTSSDKIHLVSTYEQGGREVEVPGKTKLGVPVTIVKKEPGKIMVVDPLAPGAGRPNIDVKDLMARTNQKTGKPMWQAIQTMLVKNPLRNFHEVYDSPPEYFEGIGRDASEMQRAFEYKEFLAEAEEAKEPEEQEAHERGAHLAPHERMQEGLLGELKGSSSERPEERPGVPRGTSVTRGAGGGMMGPHAELGRGPQEKPAIIKRSLRDPVQASELLALHDFVLSDTGARRETLTEEDFKSAVASAAEGGLQGKEKKMMRGLVKALEKEWEEYRIYYKKLVDEYRAMTKEQRKSNPLPARLNEKQIYENALKGIYRFLSTAKTPEEFVSASMGRFSRPDIPELSPTRQQAELRTLAARERESRQAIGTQREVTIGRGRDIFGRPTAPRQGAPLTSTPLPRTAVGATGEAYLPPEMLQGPPAGITEAPAPIGKTGLSGEIPTPLRPGKQRQGYRMTVGEPFGRAGERYDEPSATLRRVQATPSEIRPNVAQGPPHPLAGRDPWEGKFRAEVVPELSMREPNPLEAEADRLRQQQRRMAAEQEEKLKYLPGMRPEAFDQVQERVKEETSRVLDRMKAKFITRREAKEGVYTELDSVLGLSNLDAANKGNFVRESSKGRVSAALQAAGRYALSRLPFTRSKEFRTQAEKAAMVRKAAVAVVSSGEIVSGGATYVDKYGNKRQRMYWQANKDKITGPMVYNRLGIPDAKQSGLIAMAEEAMKQAQISMGKKDLWYRLMGKKWFAAAKELRDAAIWARDHWLDPELRETVDAARQTLKDQWQKEADQHLRLRRDWNYTPGRYDGELWNDDKVIFGAPRVLGRNFRQPATFDNYYHAILSGPYIPKNLDIADLVEHRARQGNEVLAKNKWNNYLMGLIDPDSKRPVAVEITHGEPIPIMEKGQILRDAKGRSQTGPSGEPLRGPPQQKQDALGRMLTTPGKMHLPDGYEPVVLDNGKKVIGVLTAYKTAVRNAAGESPIRQNPVTAEFLHFGQMLKHHGILIYDFFHPSRLAQYAAALGGDPRRLQNWKAGYARGFAALEYRPEDLDRAVENGSVIKADADWAKEKVPIFIDGQRYDAPRYEILRMAVQHGANVGKLQDALYSNSKSIIPGVEKMNKWVFRGVTRGLMAEAIVRNFEQLNNKYPNMNASVLMRQVSKDMNFFFGSIGRQGVIKSPLLRDMSQMVFLAPQWVEGLAQKETRFYSRLATAPVKYALGHEGPKLGALGGAMLKGLATYFALTQVFNLIFRQKFTFQNEEEDHKWDAWIPAGHNGFWISPMSVFAELSHDIIRLMETKPTAYDAISQIGANKLGPWGRVGAVLTTKQTAQGEFIPTTWGRLKEAGSQLTPLPITLAGPAKWAGSKVGLAQPPQPGSGIRQLFSTVGGMKGQPADSPLQRMERLARKYVADNHLKADSMEFLPTTEPSYSKLRSIIRAGDTNSAVRMLEQVRKEHTDNQIYHAMRAWASAPLTGSHLNEQKFIAHLTPEQRLTYSHAMEERLNILQGYIQVYQLYRRGK